MIRITEQLCTKKLQTKDRLRLQSYTIKIDGVQFRQLTDLPICQWCSKCRKLERTGSNRYDIDCAANPNLGAVSTSLSRCCSYDGKKVQIK